MAGLGPSTTSGRFGLAEDAGASDRVGFPGLVDLLVTANPTGYEEGGPPGNDRRVDQSARPHGS